MSINSKTTIRILSINPNLVDYRFEIKVKTPGTFILMKIFYRFDKIQPYCGALWRKN